MIDQNNKDIIHIEINNWDDEFETKKCQEIFDSNQHIEFPFNYVITLVDQADFYLITTTEEDLKKYGYEELLKYQVNFDEDIFLFPKNFFPKYNPSKWYTKENGKWFDNYKYFRTIYLFVDKFGNEMMYTTEFCSTIYKVDEYLEKFKNTFIQNNTYDLLVKYIKDHSYHYGRGWYNNIEYVKIEDKEIKVPTLKGCIPLPVGFIEYALGHKMTFEDKPKEWIPFNIQDLKIWED